MPTQLIGAVVVFVALMLGACALRALALQVLSAREPARTALLHVTTLMSLAAWFVNAAWAVYARVGYGLALIALALLASRAVSARSAAAWYAVRYWVAIATTASAALLWSALPR